MGNPTAAPPWSKDSFEGGKVNLACVSCALCTQASGGKNFRSHLETREDRNRKPILDL